MRTFFGEVAAGPRGPAIGIRGWNDSHNTLIIGLVLFTLYLKIPQWFIKGYDIERGYGFSFTEHALHWNWNHVCKVFNYPWTWDFYRKTILRPDGSVWRDGKGIDDHLIHAPIKQTFPYNYLMRDGTVQTCVATVYGDEMEWRMRCAKWLPWPRKIRRYINVAFSEEMGPRRGSWKGGVMATGHQWRPGDTLQEALRKMERERTFNG